MFNHTGTGGFFLFSIATQSPLYWFYMFLSIACKVAVPVFFMISGALLLGKEESIGTLYKKRVLKWVLVLIVTSMLYHVYNWHYNHAVLNFVQCFKDMYVKRASVALWFLYSYIGVLMMLPLLRKMVRSMTRNDYLYLAAGQLLLVGIIPIAQFYLSDGTLHLNGSFSATLFTASNIFYFVMGYFFERVLGERHYNKRTLLMLAAASCVVIGISCFMTQYKADLTGELSEGKSQVFHNALIALPVFTTYYGAKFFFMKRKVGDTLRCLIQFSGAATMGIYLAERVLRERLYFVFNDLKPVLHSLPACLIHIFVCLVVGVIVFGILNKVMSMLPGRRVRH